MPRVSDEWIVCAYDKDMPAGIGHESIVNLSYLNTPEEIRTGWYVDVPTGVQGLFFDISRHDVPFFRACSHDIVLSFLHLHTPLYPEENSTRHTAYVVVHVALLPADVHSSLERPSNILEPVPSWCSAVLEMRPADARLYSTDVTGTTLYKRNPVLRRPFKNTPVTVDDFGKAFQPLW